MASKYTQDEIDALGAKGHAFKNPDGHYSYPVDDEEDLDNAIRAVGRGGADHDAIRKYVIGRARAMGKSSMIPGNWNADGSLKGSSSAIRTPFELLKRRRGSMAHRAERRGLLLEMRTQPDGTGGTNFVFEGYGATFDEPFEMWDPWGDPYTEVVRPGAFRESLGRPGLDVPFLIGHDDSRLALARTRNGTMQLSEDSRGLLVRALLDGRRSDVRDLAYAVERGDMDEMSIGFITEQQAWSDDWMLREMLRLNMHRGDVSPVALGANAGTAGSTVAAAMPGATAWSAPWQPAGRERRAADDASGEIADVSDAPDYNPGAVDVNDDGTHAPVTGAHRHPHPAFGAHDTGPDGMHGHGHRHENDNIHNPAVAAGSHDHQYNADGTIVLDDSGVVEEVGGAMADADLLSRRLRLLELA